MAGLCSTPFGITASPRAGGALMKANADACSTPFGITASPRLQHIAIARVADRCSTPFGITASPRGLAERHLGGLVVLNAFRHHRVAEEVAKKKVFVDAQCSTPFGITASPRPDQGKRAASIC